MHRVKALLPVGALAVLAAMALGGCNTVSGAGQDVAATGKAISRGATATENKVFGSGQQQPQSAQAPEQQQEQPGYHPSPAYSSPGQ